MFEKLEEKVRARAARIARLSVEQKNKLLKTFEGWLDTKQIRKVTRKYYLEDASEILRVDADTIVSFCVYCQNSRTVLRYLDELRNEMERRGEL